MSNFLSSSYLTQQIVNDTSFVQRASRSAPASAPGGAVAKLTVRPGSGSSKVAETLANTYPMAQRAQARKVFDELLAGYPKVEAQLGLPPGDLGGAVAACLTGAYAGVTGAMPPDEYFAPLAQQMRTALAGTPSVVEATEAQRRQLYETMALLGLLTSTTVLGLRAQPNGPQTDAIRANLKEASKGYLRDLLGVDAERITLGPKGMSLR